MKYNVKISTPFGIRWWCGERRVGSIPEESVNNLDYFFSGDDSDFDATIMSFNLGEKLISKLSEHFSKDKFTFTIYSFLPADECTMQFDITAMTDEDTEIKSRSFADVPMKLNHMSIYTGNFFKNDVEGNTNGFTLSIEDGEWIKDDFTF